LFGEDSVYVLLGTALISAVAKLTAVFTLAVGCKLRKGKLYGSPQGIEAASSGSTVCLRKASTIAPSSNDRTAEREAFGISLPDSPHSGTRHSIS
jgi:hypothetical protein